MAEKLKEKKATPAKKEKISDTKSKQNPQEEVNSNKVKKSKPKSEKATDKKASGKNTASQSTTKTPNAAKLPREARSAKDTEKDNKVSSKLKLLKVLDILKDTDEQHPVTANEITDKLADEGIPSERKSVARDISYLKEYGYEIMVHHDNKQGYFLAKRTFEDWEIKVLMDAVNSCKFLTSKDAGALCDKLLTLPNKWGKEMLSNIIVLEPPSRTKESKTKYCIDVILDAIKRNVQIEFKYYDLDIDGHYHSRKNGKFYQVTPYMLVWSSDNYYLIANTFDYDNISIYRLDRMKFVVAIDVKRKDISEIHGYNGENWLKDYISKTFSMYVGNETQLKVLCKNYSIGRIFDRFGTDIDIKKWDKDTVIVTLNVVESDALYAYFVLYSRSMKVIYPKHISTEIACMIREGLENYNSQFTQPNENENDDENAIGNDDDNVNENVDENKKLD